MNGERHNILVSTQITIRERLDANPLLADRYFVLAQSQTAGRGRGDRQWASTAGNLHASILIRQTPFTIPTWVPLWVSVCAHRALSRMGVPDHRLQLKWPNDLWLDGSFKVSGVLCEKKGEVIIAGIGMNLVHAPLPDSAVTPFSGEAPSPESMIKEIIDELAMETGVDAIRSYYDRHCLFRNGEELSWISNGQKKQGRVVGLGEYGELIVETDLGRIPLYSEDVSGVSPPKEKDRSI